jgi:beta-lactamase class A
MKKSGGSSFKFSSGRSRKPRRSSQTQNGAPDFVAPELRQTPNPLPNPAPKLSVADRRAQLNRSKSQETSSKGFLGFLPKFGKKRSAKVAPRSEPLGARVVEFPKKPQRSKLEELRSKRRERAPPKHALFSPPDNPIRIPRPHNRPQAALLYVVRLLILGVGLAVISGTILSIWDPTTRLNAGANAPNVEADAPAAVQGDSNPLPLGQELTSLKTQIQTLMTQNPKLSPSVMLVDLDSHAYVDLNAEESRAAASTIKVPILIAFFQDVDQGKIQLDQMLVMRKDLVASESGEMQYLPVGSKFSAIKTVTNMITVSDNTATNMLIDLLGGYDVLNQRFQSWGLTGTMVHNQLPDVQGTNTTTAKDMGIMLSLLSQGKLMSFKSRDRVLDIMRRVESTGLLPHGLGEGATISHKTGTIGLMLGDVGLIDTAMGRRYVAAVLVKRPRDDDRANSLIQQISKLSYQAFNQQTTSIAAPPIGKNVPK